MRRACRYDHGRGSTIIDARGIAGGHRAVRTESPLEFAKSLPGSAEANVFVRIEECGALPRANFHSRNLSLEFPCLLRRFRRLLLVRRELMLLLTPNLALRGPAF